VDLHLLCGEAREARGAPDTLAAHSQFFPSHRISYASILVVNNSPTSKDEAPARGVGAQSQSRSALRVPPCAGANSWVLIPSTQQRVFQNSSYRHQQARLKMGLVLVLLYAQQPVRDSFTCHSCAALHVCSACIDMCHNGHVVERSRRGRTDTLGRLRVWIWCSLPSGSDGTGQCAAKGLRSRSSK